MKHWMLQNIIIHKSDKIKTAKDARKHARKVNKKAGKVVEKTLTFHFRIKDPKLFDLFRSMKLSPTTTIVLGRLK